jgi:hypothetical protein
MDDDDDSIHTDGLLDEQDEKSVKKNLKPSANNPLLDSVSSPSKTEDINESLVKEELTSTLDKKKVAQESQKPSSNTNKQHPASNDKFKLPDDEYEEEPFEEEYIN